jgi:hypothetical protein
MIGEMYYQVLKFYGLNVSWGNFVLVVHLKYIVQLPCSNRVMTALTNTQYSTENEYQNLVQTILKLNSSYLVMDKGDTLV